MVKINDHFSYFELITLLGLKGARHTLVFYSVGPMECSGLCSSVFTSLIAISMSLPKPDKMRQRINVGETWDKGFNIFQSQHVSHTQ